MAILAELVDHVIGVDPDRDRVTAAVVCAKTQGELASKTFPATRRGYGQTLRWAQTQTVDDRRAWAIESTGSYGAGLAIVLAEKGEFVIEFDHPGTLASKDGAKSDSLDAVRAARETLGRKTWATPRARGLREGLRACLMWTKRVVVHDVIRDRRAVSTFGAGCVVGDRRTAHSTLRVPATGRWQCTGRRPGSVHGDCVRVDQRLRLAAPATVVRGDRPDRPSTLHGLGARRGVREPAP